MRCGIIGQRLAHSISPAFQNAAFRALGIDTTYEPWETEPERLAEVVESLRRPDALGANVTVPYKETVVPLVDALHDDAAATGAVNTIVRRDGRLDGYNTDVAGFARALEGMPGGGRPQHAVVIGAGGAARAIVLALARSGARDIAVLNRTVERAIALCEQLAEAASVPLMPLPLDAAARAVRSADIVVNATSVGMAYGPDEGRSPLPAELLRPGLLVCDLVANPLETPLLKAATAAGARTLGGLPMLVEQGAASFSLWTGRAAPLDVMRDAARKAMAAAPA